MSDIPAPSALRLEILNALEPSSDGQDLSVLHLLLNRSRRDTSMLPVMGALVSGGYLEKVPTRTVSSANAPISAARGRRDSAPGPVRFRLTSAGRQLLEDERAHAPRQLQAAHAAAEGDGDDESEFDDDRE